LDKETAEWLLEEIRKIVRSEIHRLMVVQNVSVPTGGGKAPKKKSVKKAPSSKHWIKTLKAQKGVPELVHFIIHSICRVNGWKRIPSDVCQRPATDAYAALKFLMENGMTVKEIRDALAFWASPDFDEQRRFIMISRPLQLKERMARIQAAMKKSQKDYSHLNPKLVQALSSFTKRQPDDPNLLSIAEALQFYYRQSPLWKTARKKTESYDRVVQIYGSDEAAMVRWFGEWLKNQSWVTNSERLPLSFFKPTSSSFRGWIEENAKDWGCGKL